MPTTDLATCAPLDPACLEPACREPAWRYPRLAPHALVLRRRPGEVQVGLDPESALVLSGVRYPALLATLTGAHPLAEVYRQAEAAGLARTEVSRTLQLLGEAGLLGSSPGGRVDPDRAGHGRPAVRLLGAGATARRLAPLLLHGGVARLLVFDPEPAEPDELAVPGTAASRAVALRATLPPGTPGEVAVLDHWSRPVGEVDLTVLVTDAPEVDRVLTEHLARLDHPHLLVRTPGTGGCVGPLVVPGRTSCVRCSDLTRRDLDPCWPTLLAQLVRPRLRPAAAVAGWAAGVAAAQVLGFLAGGQPECLGATLELTTTDFGMRHRPWPVHPGCGCGWLAPPEWAA